MLHEILEPIAGAAAAVYKSTFLTSYLFPLTSGVWLAFVTANLIRLRDARMRAVLILASIRSQVASMPPGSPTEVKFRAVAFGAEMGALADELRFLGYDRTADRFAQAVMDIQNEILNAWTEIEVGMGIFPVPRELPTTLRDVQIIHVDAAEEFFLEARKRAADIVSSKVPQAVRSVHTAPTEWLLVVELHSLRRFLDKRARGRRSDCGDCCENCNGQV